MRSWKRRKSHKQPFGCSPYHTNSAFYPVTVFVEQALGWDERDSPESKLEKLETELRSFSLPFEETVPLFASLMSLPLPDDRYPPLNLTPQQQKERTLDAVVAWRLESAERRPLLQIWEDLHWADPSTLELLSLEIEQAPTAPVLNVLTFRPDFMPPWSHRTHMTPLTLNRLERPEVEALIAQHSGAKELPAEVVEHIVERADGVPLYVEELTKAILEADFLLEHDGRYELSGPLSGVAIPATLQDSLMARLDRLPSIREVAQIGAVLGREFAYEMVQAILSVEEKVLQQGLAQLVDAGIIVPAWQATAIQVHFQTCSGPRCRLPIAAETHATVLPRSGGGIDRSAVSGDCSNPAGTSGSSFCGGRSGRINLRPIGCVPASKRRKDLQILKLLRT